MNNQLLFDRVTNHLLTQRQCSEGDGSCLYRGPNGLKCAVGVLIEDEYYDPEMETNSPKNDLVRKALEKSLGEKMTLDNISLLTNLQDIHDNVDPGEWDIELRNYADKNDLQFNYDEKAA